MSVQEGSDNSPPLYGEIFEQEFPKYLAMGMTYDQYWHGESSLPKYYREADKIRLEKRNQELWLQGMYIYEAIARLTPIPVGFAKKGSKPKPYVPEPYSLTEEVKKAKEEKKTKDNYLKMLEKMQKKWGKKQ